MIFLLEDFGSIDGSLVSRPLLVVNVGVPLSLTLVAVLFIS